MVMEGQTMANLKNEEQKEAWARFCVRLALDLRKNTRLVWSDKFNRYLSPA